MSNDDIIKLISMALAANCQIPVTITPQGFSGDETETGEEQ